MKKSVEASKAVLMGEEKIPRLLIKFAIPTIVAMLINAINLAVDAMFVSWIGTTEAGAISIVFPIFMLITGVGLTFGTGAGSYISRLLGMEDRNEVNRTASIAVFTSVIIALISAIGGLIFINPVLRFAGATDTILPLAREYGTIVIFGSVFPVVSLAYTNIMRAEGNVKFGSIVMMLGAVLNIVIDPIFIFTFDMGIKGAAYATVLSQVIPTAAFLSYFASGKSDVKISLKDFKPNKKIYLEILKIGVPTFLFQLLMSISQGFINSNVAPFGDSAVAAMGIANRVFTIGMYVVFGYSKGFQPIVGYNYGTGKLERVKEAIVFSVKQTTIFCITATVLAFIFSKQIMSVFIDDPLAQAVGAKALVALHMTFPLFGVQQIITSLFLALGKGKEGGLLSMARQGIFFLPMILILPKLYGLEGVIYAQPAADLLTSALAIILGWKLYKNVILGGYKNENTQSSRAV